MRKPYGSIMYIRTNSFSASLLTGGGAGVRFAGSRGGRHECYTVGRVDEGTKGNNEYCTGLLVIPLKASV